MRVHGQQAPARHARHGGGVRRAREGGGRSGRYWGRREAVGEEGQEGVDALLVWRLGRREEGVKIERAFVAPLHRINEASPHAPTCKHASYTDADAVPPPRAGSGTVGASPASAPSSSSIRRPAHGSPSHAHSRRAKPSAAASASGDRSAGGGSGCCWSSDWPDWSRKARASRASVASVAQAPAAARSGAWRVDADGGHMCVYVVSSDDGLASQRLLACSLTHRQ